ncbi:MAG TPA: Gfo/Idh/MocA family oxidoreductase [Gaiellaceae bacterium]|nr:Gfo/Idh/MocA family oxidoreductase [Gaiellaceae bacterium]
MSEPAGPVGAALVGTGMFAGQLAAAIARTAALELVTCFSRDAARREAFAEQAGCEAAPSFEAVIEDPRVEAVLLATPNFAHAEQGIACAERGRHVFVEKPIADTLADGSALREACEAAGVALVVGHDLRRLGAARAVKRLVDEGALGRVVLADLNFSLAGTLRPESWRYRRETCPGGPLLQLGVHHADTLLYWLGPAVRVQGSFARLVTGAEIDDVGVALVELESGARATIASSYVSPKTYSARLLGTEGVLDYVADASVWPRAELLDGATTLRLTTSAGSEDVPFEPRDPVVEELEELARCARGEAKPETGAAESLAALGIVLAAIDSAEAGRPVEIAAPEAKP